jgi:hypothetical protein
VCCSHFVHVQVFEMSKATEPLSLVAEAMQIVQTLAQRGADPARVEREISAVISGWIETGRAGALDAMDLLRDNLAAAVEDTAAEVENLDREDSAGIRAGQRVVACLEAARDAAKAAMASL